MFSKSKMCKTNWIISSEMNQRKKEFKEGNYSWKYNISLSKCLKYPGFIFLCPQKLSKKNPRKKPKSLNYPNTIPEIFSEFGYVQDFFYVPRNIRGKKQTPWTIQIVSDFFGDLAKFSRILHENKNLYNLCFFCKKLAMFNSVL